MVLFYRSYGNLAISPDRAFFIQGHDFFSFMFELLCGAHQGSVAVVVMTAGIVVLILTPLVRVALSVVYFGWERNLKYVAITIFVLVVLVLSLALH